MLFRSGVGHVRGQGMMAAVEVVANKATKEYFPPEVGLGERLIEAMFERGLCTRVLMDSILLAPPLMIADDLIDRIVDAVGESIEAVLAGVHAG